MGPGNRLIDLITGPYRLVRRCEVTAVLILYGLPRYFFSISSISLAILNTLLELFCSGITLLAK